MSIVSNVLVDFEASFLGMVMTEFTKDVPIIINIIVAFQIAIGAVIVIVVVNCICVFIISSTSSFHLIVTGQIESANNFAPHIENLYC
jgi:hypothetical protein